MNDDQAGGPDVAATAPQPLPADPGPATGGAIAGGAALTSGNGGPLTNGNGASFTAGGPPELTPVPAPPAPEPPAPEPGSSGPASEPGSAEDTRPEDTKAEPETGGDGEGEGAKPARKPAKHGWSAWKELPILIVVALAIALVIKSFVVQPFFIPSSSMEDTLLIGDKVLVNKLVYHFRGIHRGDVIVFNGTGSWNPPAPPSNPSGDPVVRAYDVTLRPLFSSIAGLFGTPADAGTDYIKRVIGLPGDHVVCCNAQGLVTVNGVALHETSYLFPGASPSLIHFSITVPPGRLWVMGDNRQVSDDSRMRPFDPGHGTIPENEVVGRAFVIVWPASRWRFLPIPSTFDQPRLTGAAGKTDASGAAGPAQTATPLAAGLVAAVPLTWLQRRARRRITARRSRQ